MDWRLMWEKTKLKWHRQEDLSLQSTERKRSTKLQRLIFALILNTAPSSCFFVFLFFRSPDAYYRRDWSLRLEPSELRKLNEISAGIIRAYTFPRCARKHFQRREISMSQSGAGNLRKCNHLLIMMLITACCLKKINLIILAYNLLGSCNYSDKAFRMYLWLNMSRNYWKKM